MTKENIAILSVIFDENIIEKLDSELLEKTVNWVDINFNSTEKLVIYSLHTEGKSPEDVARKLLISCDEAQMISARTLRKLRHPITRKTLDEIFKIMKKESDVII